MATIYIVEDDVNIREIERYALKNGGFDVVEFERGSDLSAAVDVYKRQVLITVE